MYFIQSKEKPDRCAIIDPSNKGPFDVGRIFRNVLKEGVLGHLGGHRTFVIVLDQTLGHELGKVDSPTTEIRIARKLVTLPQSFSSMLTKLFQLFTLFHTLLYRTLSNLS